MNKLYQRYISFLYLKNFFVIFLSLEFFYVSVDLLSNLKNLPSSANLQLLYIYFNAQIAVSYTLPLSLVFAMIVSKMTMIKSNELISLYASTISKSKAILPIFLVSFIITCILIGLNCTSFVYANNYKNNLIKYNSIEMDISKVFVRFHDSYVFLDKLNPFKKEALNIKIFKVENGVLKTITNIKKAYYKNSAWHSENATITIIPKVKKIGDKGLVVEHAKNTVFLHGFKPKIMDTIHQNKSFLSIIDAYEALKFLKNQNVNIHQIKSTLYYLIFFPLFAPLMTVILFFYLPISARFFNLALYNFIFIFITLCVWGTLFLLSKFSLNGVILAELGTVLPIVLMSFFALVLYLKNNN